MWYTTVSKACSHLLNYSSGHETLTGKLGSSRFNYPKFHIESDNRLAWLLGRLDEKFGDKALYVHLTRNNRDTAKSFAKRQGGIMAAYQGSGIIMGLMEEDQVTVAEDYVNTVTKNIELFLTDKSHKMKLRLEHGKQDFRSLWEEIEGEGDLNSALCEFDVKYNKSQS